MFIYAFSEDDKDELIKHGNELICSCRISGQIAYAFENTPSACATFSEDIRKECLITDVAYFV